MLHARCGPLPACVGVHAGSRLINQNNVRVSKERDCHTELAPFSAAEIASLPVQLGVESHLLASRMHNL